jgi:hypothetical protein
MEANQKIIPSDPNFDPTDPAWWQQHLEDTKYDGSDYFNVPFRSVGSRELALAIDVPGAFAGWVPPAMAHVYAQNPESGAFEVRSFPVGGYQPTLKSIIVGSGIPQEEWSNAHVAITGHDPMRAVLPQPYGYVPKAINSLLSPSAYRVTAYGGFPGNPRSAWDDLLGR